MWESKCPFCGHVRLTRQHESDTILCPNCQLSRRTAKYNEIYFMRMGWGGVMRLVSQFKVNEVVDNNATAVICNIHQKHKPVEMIKYV